MSEVCVGISIPGPRGRDGIDGTDGVDGAAGATGATGATGAAGSLTGVAGGDLAGTYPNPTVALLAVTSAKMSVTGVVAGTYGSSTFIPVVTFDAAGRATAASVVAVSASSAPTGVAGGDLTGSYPNPTIAAGAVTTAKLAVTGVGAGTYGSGTAIPVVTLGVDGRVTAISTIAPVFSGTAPTASNAQVTGTGSDYTVTTSYSPIVFGGTSPVVALPAAGTYLITARVNYASGAGASECYARLYDSTAAAFIADSAAHEAWTGTGAKAGQLILSNIIVVGVASSITVQALRTVGVAVTITSTMTSISYIRLA